MYELYELYASVFVRIERSAYTFAHSHDEKTNQIKDTHFFSVLLRALSMYVQILNFHYRRKKELHFMYPIQHDLTRQIVNKIENRPSSQI